VNKSGIRRKIFKEELKEKGGIVGQEEEDKWRGTTKRRN
jgi:hypothetical protein